MEEEGSKGTILSNYRRKPMAPVLSPSLRRFRKFYENIFSPLVKESYIQRCYRKRIFSNGPTLLQEACYVCVRPSVRWCYFDRRLCKWDICNSLRGRIAEKRVQRRDPWYWLYTDLIPAGWILQFSIGCFYRSSTPHVQLNKGRRVSVCEQKA